MCDECAILREHYPRDPEVRLERVRLFSPGCDEAELRALAKSPTWAVEPKGKN